MCSAMHRHTHTHTQLSFSCSHLTHAFSISYTDHSHYECTRNSKISECRTFAIFNKPMCMCDVRAKQERRALFIQFVKFRMQMSKDNDTVHTCTLHKQTHNENESDENRTLKDMKMKTEPNCTESGYRK